ncbi:Fic family protein [Bacteroides sp.]|uniref:Fic family protein n=1 Tax=Bacteroides sp. TaxID=29523 RepID=UPI00261C5C0C|nr:Fic family protein [Bacteroides sp.]MDD3039250.1 Fic family protein [Bacteroides sp.]
MATIAELLASSLNVLKQVQQNGDFTIVKSGDISPTHIKRLVNNNFLRQIIKGWYVITDPRAMPGDSTAWYASFWSFIARYAKERYGNDWCLSAEQSLAIYTGSTIVPNQVLIRTPKGNNYVVELIPPTSIFNLGAELPSKIDTNNPYKLNLYTIHEAIIVATPTMYRNDALTMRTALAMVRDGSEILKILVDTGQTVRAGRVIGAFRNIGRADIADEIAGTMKRIGYVFQEEDPFTEVVKVGLSPSPYATRLRLMWKNMREDVIANFTRSKSSFSSNEFLERMEAQYKLDAYHSLSIEGYRVTDELINKVRSGAWKPDGDDADSKNALAARGYWQAFQAVKKSVSDILGGGNSANIAERDLSVWHSEMFMPCVAAGIIKPSDIVGYRSHQVYIRNSMHTPLNSDALRDAMTTLFELLKEEPEASVRAVLGHFVFTYIHPYMDGNGRVGRFLMNTMLASGGYDWVIIPVERRDEYMVALEKASVAGDIVPFVKFLSSI